MLVAQDGEGLVRVGEQVVAQVAPGGLVLSRVVFAAEPGRLDRCAGCAAGRGQSGILSDWAD